MVQRVRLGQPLGGVAREFGVSPRTVRKWLARYLAEGEAGLCDRSSRPRHCPRTTPARSVRRVLALRRRRFTAARIAHTVGVAPATVSRVLKRHGLNRLKALAPPEPVRRYQRARPGELVHLDTKPLGRFVRPGHRVTGRRRRSARRGFEYVHVAIDDRSRIAYARIYPDQSAPSAAAFLEAALTYYDRLGVRVERVMTDNAWCYLSRPFQRLCQQHRIKHLRTRPYRPCTNGKAERFIQTALREWAYAQAYRTSVMRGRHLAPWLHEYNWHRPHGSLNDQTPMSILPLSGNNVLRLHN